MKRSHHHLLHFNPIADPKLFAMDNPDHWGKNQSDNGLDELLAVLGYKVRTSDMAEVAQKLEKLEQAMDEGLSAISHLASETIHYNPSDISSWVETMMSEINPSDDSDLNSIPGKAIISGSKRFKLEESIKPVQPILLEENGIRIVHSLTACAEAIQQENFSLAAVLVKQIGVLAAAQTGPMGKVAIFFAEALARRIYGVCAVNDPISNDLRMHFYEAGPYMKFAHFTANQAILEAVEGRSSVHVVDFSMNEGIQWPALMQALSIGGIRSFRVTCVGIGEPNHETGVRLGQFAETIGIRFSYRGIRVSKLEDMDLGVLEIGRDEALAVNSVFDLHKFLAGYGSMEKILDLVKKMNPVIFTVVEQEAMHNGVFLDRFMESLHYYSTLFDSLEGCGWTGSSSSLDDDRAMAEVYLGQQICNIVACEGLDRVERHEPLAHWGTRFGSAGFVPVRLGSNAFKQASMLLDVFEGGEGFRVVEDSGCLMLAWHTRPLIATSAWRPGRA